jgi:hypothetical protein
VIENGALLLELGLLEQRYDRNGGKPNNRRDGSPYTGFNRFMGVDNGVPQESADSKREIDEGVNTSQEEIADSEYFLEGVFVKGIGSAHHVDSGIGEKG